MGAIGAGCGDDDDGGSAAGSGGNAGQASAGRSGSGTSGAGGKASAGAGSAGKAGGGAGAKAGAGGAGGKGTAGASGSGTGGTGSTTTEDAGTAADIVETATAAGSFTRLTAALTKAGLVDALKADGPFTVFAPSDAAFAALDAEQPGLVDGLSANELATVLKYHVISGAAIKSSALQNGQLAESLAGPQLAVSIVSGAVKINAATVTTADIEASNGIIHVVDKVILPPGDIVEVATAGGFTKLAAALQSASLVSALKGDGPFTVFAPTDAAFDALGSGAPTGDALATVLQYHVLSGIVGPLALKDNGAAVTLAKSPLLFSVTGGAKIIDGTSTAANITITNVVASNGIIHVIDKVITPPTNDIVATATALGFSSLADALTSADLVSTLQGDGPFTVFAPTNAAFTALGTAPTGDDLKNVLLYHVVSGAVGSGDLTAGSVPTLLSGESLTVNLTGGVTINTVPVATPNVLAKNGIIHAIGTVLVPN